MSTSASVRNSVPSPDVQSHANSAAGAAPTSAFGPPLGTIINDGTIAGTLWLAPALAYGGYGVVYR